MNYKLATSKHHVNLIGKRVRLQYTNDPYTKLRPGAEGVVVFVDDTGTISVNWEDGSNLGINPEFGDRYTIVKED
jgi:hypothetical protein